ncbi:MAG TPA: DHH family phosphoesterase, partial [Promineifilum sp.]|nr:DHH family phosphoesterase [Promineifilum sp.]
MLLFTYMKRPESLREYRWLVAPEPPPGSPLHTIGDTIHPVLRQVLYNRGLTQPGQIQSFLENHYLQSRDPFGLPDMEPAVERITRAYGTDARRWLGDMIAVYGDFDADGVTATVLLTEALRSMVADRRQIIPYIPDRFDEGYGLNLDSLAKLRAKGVSLVISVDCGIRSPVEAAHARSIGLDLIITDHHGLGREIPPAVAVINPKRPDSTYPEQMLAGVGIAFKLAQAMRQFAPDLV